MRRIASYTLVLALTAGCGAHAPPTPELPSRTVVVFPANNRTADPLLVSGASLLGRFLRNGERITVGDVLAWEARLQLEDGGFEVSSSDDVPGGAAPASPQAAAAIAARDAHQGLALYIEIRRWEPDAPVHTTFVIAGVSATLVDVASKNVVWSSDHVASPIATPGEVTIEGAYTTAARKLAAKLFGDLDAPVGP